MSNHLSQNFSGYNFPCCSGVVCHDSHGPKLIMYGDYYIYSYDDAICTACAPYHINDLLSDLIYTAKELIRYTPAKMGNEMIYLLGSKPKLILEE